MTADDLVTWLRAQLDDDERAAREAGYRALTWSANGTWYLEGVEHNVVGQEEAFCHPHNVEHIAGHDPARVLAEVDAKRRILDMYEQAEAVLESDHDWEEVDIAAKRAGALLDVIRLGALPYADRPGYRDEWAPTA